MPRPPTPHPRRPQGPQPTRGHCTVPGALQPMLARQQQDAPGAARCAGGEALGVVPVFLREDHSRGSRRVAGVLSSLGGPWASRSEETHSHGSHRPREWRPHPVQFPAQQRPQLVLLYPKLASLVVEFCPGEHPRVSWTRQRVGGSSFSAPELPDQSSVSTQPLLLVQKPSCVSDA